MITFSWNYHHSLRFQFLFVSLKAIMDKANKEAEKIVADSEKTFRTAYGQMAVVTNQCNTGARAVSKEMAKNAAEQAR